MPFRRASSRHPSFHRAAGRFLAWSLLLVLLAACGAAPTPVTALTPQGAEVPLNVLSALPPERVMVALVFGQSNSANSGTPPANGGPGVYGFHGGKLYEAQDPLLGATGGGGSVWTRLGPKLLGGGQYDAVVFASVGVGGSAVARWAVDGDLHPRVVEAARSLKGQGLTPTHLLWHQGEADSALGTSKAAYQARFLAMLKGLRAEGVDAPVYVSVASRCYSRPLSEPVRQAQQGLVSEALGIRAGPDTDQLGPSYRPDGCHFGAEGLERYAELWLGALGAAPHKSSQVLSFDLSGLRKTLGEPAFSASPYAAATSGLAVTFATSSPLVCTVTEDGLVTLVGAGTCTLTASQSGNTVYAAAPSVTRSFAVAAPPAETYRIDFEKVPTNALLYSVKLGGGVVYTGAGIPRTGTVPVVGKRRVNGTVLSAHLAKVVSLYGSKRLSVVSPNTATPAPQGGRLKLSFSNLDPKGVTLTSLTLSDLTAGGATLALTHADGTSSRQLLGTTARGGSLKVPLTAKGVVAAEVFAPTAFAVDDVAFTVEGR